MKETLCGIDKPSAVARALNLECKLLVVNFGRVFEVSFVEGMKTLESEILPDAGGDEFDKIFAEWLMRRVGESDERNKKFYIEEAEKIKIALSSDENYEFSKIPPPPTAVPLPFTREENTLDSFTPLAKGGMPAKRSFCFTGQGGFNPLTITRSDFERLIRFHVRRAAHLIDSMAERHRPEKIFAIGEGCKIPLVREMLQEIGAEICPREIVAKGTAMFTVPQEPRQNFDKLERKLAEIKKRLPPRQGESLYEIMSAAKKFNSLEITEILEETLSEITLSI